MPSKVAGLDWCWFTSANRTEVVNTLLEAGFQSIWAQHSGEDGAPDLAGALLLDLPTVSCNASLADSPAEWERQWEELTDDLDVWIQATTARRRLTKVYAWGIHLEESTLLLSRPVASKQGRTLFHASFENSRCSGVWTQTAVPLSDGFVFFHGYDVTDWPSRAIGIPAQDPEDDIDLEYHYLEWSFPKYLNVMPDSFSIAYEDDEDIQAMVKEAFSQVEDDDLNDDREERAGEDMLSEEI